MFIKLHRIVLGWIPSDVDPHWSADEQDRALEDESIMTFIRSKQPLDGGRVGRPEDLDAAVVYFLSDQSKFVTGQLLAIDGGWSVSEGPSS